MKKLFLFFAIIWSYTLMATPLDKLNLSTEQLQKIDKIRQEAPLLMRPLRQQIRQKRQQLQDMLANTTSKQQQLTELYGEIRELENKMMLLKFNRMLKIRQILTPKQKQLAARLFLQISKHHKHQCGEHRYRSTGP